MVIKAILTGISLAAVILTAQVTHEPGIVLKNWPAPSYWLASQPETDAAGDQASTLLHPREPGPLVFVAITPCRVVDTRATQMFAAPFGAPSLTPGPARSFPIQSTTLCPVPHTAKAYSFNVTLVPPGAVGYLKLWPTGTAEPNAVTLDDLLGTIVNNAAIVPAGTPNGSVSAVVNANTDLVIDINGYYAPPNVLGETNTSNGYVALYFNTTGTNNSAYGSAALYVNSTGSDNTANGYSALLSNTSGGGNTASGEGALYSNTTGYYNTASGFDALYSNTTGSLNIGTGYQALYHNSTGGSNIAIGTLAGSDVTGSYNIDIGNPGASPESYAIRIGDDALQRFFFAAGIYGVTPNEQNGVPVLISSNGQLGTTNSSRRFKEDIQDMADSSNGLLRLRPVTYRYQRPYEDGSKPIDYGLIAEEVAEIYPDLVVKGKDGQVETVQYQKLTPMLLNELQKQQAQITALRKLVETLLPGKAPVPISQ